MGQHRSKIASTILRAGARWAAIAAVVMCAVLALPACATTHLLQVLPFLALPIAVAPAFQLALAFDFAIGKQAVGLEHVPPSRARLGYTLRRALGYGRAR
jgi:hypothetical protein